MPVTARLSKKFYERFGEDVTTELVDWFNSVDAAYRQEFRDLFEVNFGRFEARLQQGLAELRAEFRSETARLDVSLAEVRGELKAGLEAQGSKLIAWSFGFWVANLITVLTVLKLAGVL